MEKEASSCSPACVQNIALKLTSVYETSSQDLQWDICVTLPDNHGYSAGIVQFTTGTGSAQAVISAYEKSLKNSTTGTASVVEISPFQAFDAVLSQLKQASELSGNAQGDISGLQGFCTAWKQASSNNAFKNAQLQVLNDLYWTPSQQAAKKYKLSLPISQAQIFDSVIQLGLQGTLAILHDLDAPAPSSLPNGEEQWISRFLDARREKLVSMGGAYAPTVTRVDSYKYIVENGGCGFVGNKVDALNNDGQVMSVACDAAVLNGTVGG
ncbi:lysozyme-like domain-containing protein [Obelidium mucronatum]|nr:lysozyme-like domain-containing protein [Obelidium mucronatum]